MTTSRLSIRSAAGTLEAALPPVSAGQSVGLFGGSFNPPHEGHLVVARTAERRLGLDQVWWMVTPGNPLKDTRALPEQAARMARVAALAGADPAMRVTGFEAALGSPYSAATVAFLKSRLPGVRFIWVMGADNLAHFDRWQQWRRIVRTMPVAIVDRPGWRLKALASPAGRLMAASRLPEAEAGRLKDLKPPAWVYLTTRLSSQSSTALRAGGSP